MQIKTSKTVFVLLTAHSSLSSRLFRLFTLEKYNHASIGIADDASHFFSFVTKSGFYLERPLKSKKPKKRARKCALYQLDVTEETYEAVRNRLVEFDLHAKQYRYSYLGLMLCMLRIPYYRENNYFCSQFVSELLTVTGAVQLQKQPSLYLPDDFRMEPQLKLFFQGTLGELAEVI